MGFGSERSWVSVWIEEDDLFVVVCLRGQRGEWGIPVEKRDGDVK